MQEDRAIADQQEVLGSFNVTFDRWFSEMSLVDSGAIEATLADLLEREDAARERGHEAGPCEATQHLEVAGEQRTFDAAAAQHRTCLSRQGPRVLAGEQQAEPLAVLLGITMWLTFRLNPSAMDPVQQQMFAIMPWILMFVMAPFAAGLLIYWVTSNLLTVAQQSYLYSKHPQLKAANAAEKQKAAKG